MPRSAPSRSRKPRRPGRPAEGAGEHRERLLDAALACFTRASIASTPLAAIAREAGVTPALVHYYFDDKAALVQALAAERLLPAMAGLRDAIGGSDDDAGALARAFVAGIHALVARNPWLPSIWVREILTEGGALPAGVDPRLLVVSLVGLTLFPLASQPLWRQFLDAGDVDAARLQSHTLALLGHGLETSDASSH